MYAILYNFYLACDGLAAVVLAVVLALVEIGIAMSITIEMSIAITK